MVSTSAPPSAPLYNAQSQDEVDAALTEVQSAA